MNASTTGRQACIHLVAQEGLHDEYEERDSFWLELELLDLSRHVFQIESQLYAQLKKALR